MHNNNPNAVYLGIDVHKKTYSITAICQGCVIKKATMCADPKVLLAFIKNHYSKQQIYTAYEAGFSGFNLHRYLLTNGISNIVIHPASVEVAARERVKNDKRDSEKIAEQLSAGRLKAIHVPSLEREQFRTITRLREFYIKQRKRVGNKLKSLMHQFGLIPYHQNRKVSRNFIQDILKVHIDGELGFCIKEHSTTWIYFNDKVKEVEKKIKTQAREDNTLERIYRKHKGIGVISARILANELEDLSQFSNERQLFSYIGFTPCEYSSGEHTRKGHISRQGKPILRKTLIEASWRAIRLNPELKDTFERISKNTGSKKKAIIGVARRMIGHIRASFQNERQHAVNL